MPPKTAIAAILEYDRLMFPTIHTCLTILLSLPVSNAGVERTFSTLRRLKTWLRSRMADDRLTGLALLHIHWDICINVDDVISLFANNKKINLDFVV